MLHSDRKPQSFWERISSRHQYSMDEPEQRFQRHLTTGREIGASVLYWPTMNFEKGLLYREPVRTPDGGLVRDTAGNIQTYIPKDNAIAIAYRLGTNVLFKQYFAQYGRAFSVAYNNNRDFRHTVDVSNDLLALSKTAQQLDDAPISFIHEMREAVSSPVQDMISNSIEANKLLTKFANGTLDVTPENLTSLKRQLDGLEVLAREKAGMLKGMIAMRAYGNETPDAMPENLEEFARPSGFIRDILKQDTISTMRQSEILLGFVTGLIAEGSIPLSQEQLFIPQDQVYISGEQAVTLSRYISDSMHKYGFALNSDANGGPLVSHVPAGAIIKARHSANGDTSYEQASKQEVIAFSSDLLAHVKHQLGTPIDKLTSYADEHYEDVKKIILDNPGEFRDYHDELKKMLVNSQQTRLRAPTTPNVAPGLIKPWQTRVKPQSQAEQLAALPGQTLKHAHQFYEHMTRPEVKHEVYKLFSRSVPAYILNFPIGLVSNGILGFTKRDKNWNHIPLTKENWKKHGPGLLVTPHSLQSELFQLLAYPIAESVGAVAMVEWARYPRTLALEAAKDMDDTFMAAIKTAAKQDVELKQGIELLSSSNPTQEVLEQHPEFKRIVGALKDDVQLKTAKDYELLANFYHELSAKTASDAAQVFTPYINQGESFKDALHKVTHAPVSTVGEATLALSFVRSLSMLNQKNIRWLEFIPPEVGHLDHKALGSIASYVNDQAKSAGLVAYNPKTMPKGDFEQGELVKRDARSGKIEQASKQDIIRLANVATAKFREVMGNKKLDEVTDGRYSDAYIDATEKLLFAGARLGAVTERSTPSPDEAKPKQPTATKVWNTKGVTLPGYEHQIWNATKYAVRPEARHQMNKLFWRMLFTRMAYTPINISENWLWKHKIHIDRNAPVGEQVKQFFASDNVKQSMWTLATFPVAFSYGITAMWEFGSYLFGDKEHALEESSVSDDYLRAAIKSASHIKPDMEKDMSSLEGNNPKLMALQSKPEFAKLPEIFNKPAETRNEEENKLVQHFFSQAGDTILDRTSDQLSGKLGVDKNNDSKLHDLVFEQATNATEAVRKLAIAESMIGLNKDYTAMLRYFDPEEQLIDTKELAELTAFIHKQAIGAGFEIYDPKKISADKLAKKSSPGELLERHADGKLHPMSEENLVRFANVVGEKLGKAIDSQNFEKAINGKLAEQYLAVADKHTSAAF